MTEPIVIKSNLPLARIFNTWWPLAASWVLMGAELPAVSAIVARLENPAINLAAYGGIVFPIALLIEAPVIMLLAASTALSKDMASYRLVRKYMMISGATLTGLYILIAFTPLYYVVVEGILGAPEEIVEPARIGLMIMTPWTWSIAFRRFNQGVLIRFGHPQAVTIGTIIRLTADILVLLVGYAMGSLTGVIVATSAVAMGVMSEAVYSGIAVRPVVRNEVAIAPPVAEPLTWRGFFQFYIPLAMTSLLTLLALPIGSAALSRMPRALESLAVWPVISGLIFMFRSLGVAYNEVVVALLDEPLSYAGLRRFTNLLASATTTGLLLLVVTPLSFIWFGWVSALEPDLANLAQQSMWIAIALPAIAVFQSWYQGAIVYGRRTRSITEAVVIYLVSFLMISWVGVMWGKTTGLYIGLAAMAISMFAQTAWLWFRSRRVMADIQHRDLKMSDLHPAGVSAD